MTDCTVVNDRVRELVMRISAPDFDPEEFFASLQDLQDDELAQVETLLRQCTVHA